MNSATMLTKTKLTSSLYLQEPTFSDNNRRYLRLMMLKTLASNMKAKNHRTVSIPALFVF